MRLNLAEQVMVLGSAPRLSPELIGRLRRASGELGEIPISLDWLVKHEVVNLFCHNVQSHCAQTLLGPFVATECRQAEMLWESACPVLTTLYGQVIQELGRVSEVAVLKGFATGERFYDSPVHRHFEDLDVLVAPDRIEAVKSCLRGLGFVQGWFSPDLGRVVAFAPEDVAAVEKEHYELGTFRKLERATPVGDLLLAIDVHHNLDKAFLHQDIWAGVGQEHLDGIGATCRVQSPVDALWFVASRHYVQTVSQNAPSFKRFNDVRAIVTSGREVDWARLLYIVEKYGMALSVYFVLARVDQVHAGYIPPEVIETLGDMACRRGNGIVAADPMVGLLGRSRLAPLSWE